MRRFGLLVLVLAAAVGLSAQARAATSVILDEGGPTDALGAGLWELTIQGNDAAVNNGGQFGIVGGVSFAPNTALCDDNLLVICAATQGGDIDPTLTGILYMIIAVNTANLNTATPNLLGVVSGSGLQLTTFGLDIVAGPPGEPGFSPPVTFETRPIQIVPEPAAFAFLGLGFASLAFLRRRAA